MSVGDFPASQDEVVRKISMTSSPSTAFGAVALNKNMNKGLMQQPRFLYLYHRQPVNLLLC